MASVFGSLFKGGVASVISFSEGGMVSVFIILCKRGLSSEGVMAYSSSPTPFKK